MARRLRTEYPDAIHHMMLRGDYRPCVFEYELDYQRLRRTDSTRGTR